MNITTPSLFAALALFAAAGQASASGQVAWDTDLAVVLVNEQDHTSAMVERSRVVFEIRTTRIEQDDTIERMLRNNGLFPDGEAYGAVYRLNPSLRSLGALRGIELQLPRVVGHQDILRSLQRGSLIAVTLDGTKKRQLRGRAAVLRNKLADLKLDSPIAGALRESLDAIAAFEAVIRERSLPLNPDVLAQVSSGAEMLEALLKKSELDTADRKSVFGLAEDLGVLSINLATPRGPGEPPRPYPEVDVVVKVLGVDGAELSNLRVWYVGRAYYGNEACYKTFAELTSPSLGRLPVANYRVWAAAPGKPTPVTEVIPLDVRVPVGGGSVNVELAVPR